MFATQNNKKSSADPQSMKADSAVPQTTVSEANLLWQSLALGSLTLHRKQSHGSDHPEDAPSIVSEPLRSPGHPLDPVTRSFMEERFVHDFSHVRIHTDARAAEAADAVDALAYTVGNDVVFGAGQYETGSNDGRRLLAHELTHVVQQGSEPTAARQVQRDVRDLPTATGPGNLLLFPDVTPTQVRIERLAHLTGGLIDDSALRPRLSAIVASGMTIRGLAARLLPFFTQATASGTTAPGVDNSPPTIDELAQAILVYNSRFIPVPAMTNFTVGFRLPLPIEIDPTNDEFIVSPPAIRSMAARFDAPDAVSRRRESNSPAN